MVTVAIGGKDWEEYSTSYEHRDVIHDFDRFMSRNRLRADLQIEEQCRLNFQNLTKSE